MKYFMVVFCMLLVINGPLIRSASATNESLVLFSDYAAYKYEDGSDKTYVEIYYNLLRNNLKYFPDSTGYSAIMDFKLVLRDSTGNPLDSLSWKAGSKIESLSVLDDSDYLISDVFGDLFDPGSYNIDLVVENGESRGFNSFKMNIPAFSDTVLAVSSVEWAYKISQDSTGKLLKNGFRVLPNASGRFEQEDNIIYLYAEVYNLDDSPGAGDDYSVAMEIYDNQGEMYKTIEPNLYKKPGKSSVVVTGFSIATFDGGMYNMKLKVTDGARGADVSKTFSVIPSADKIKMRMMQSVLSSYPGANEIQSEEEAKRFRNDIAYIATSDELRLYDSLNLRGKVNFQREFWEARDYDPSTPLNEFKLEHYRRIKYAEERYSRHGGMIPGWKTDQGRVYIIYGEPTDIERNQSSIETRSWEKWWYHGMEGGVFFIFVDYEDTDSYELIHSNKQNEIRDNNWEDKIRMTVYQR
jgi:GWxTD domain-containing protein